MIYLIALLKNFNCKYWYQSYQIFCLLKVAKLLVKSPKKRRKNINVLIKYNKISKITLSISPILIIKAEKTYFSLSILNTTRINITKKTKLN